MQHGFLRWGLRFLIWLTGELESPQIQPLALVGRPSLEIHVQGLDNTCAIITKLWQYKRLASLEGHFLMHRRETMIPLHYCLFKPGFPTFAAWYFCALPPAPRVRSRRNYEDLHICLSTQNVYLASRRFQQCKLRNKDDTWDYCLSCNKSANCKL